MRARGIEEAPAESSTGIWIWQHQPLVLKSGTKKNVNYLILNKHPAVLVKRTM